MKPALGDLSAPVGRTIVRSRKRIWAGRVLSGFAALFFVMDGGMKLLKVPFVVHAMIATLGYPESTIVGIGLALLTCTVLYVIPRTSALGAILLTGYLGGAVAANVRSETGWFNVFFPVIAAAVAWIGVWLRKEQPEWLVPFARKP